MLTRVTVSNCYLEMLGCVCLDGPTSGESLLLVLVDDVFLESLLSRSRMVVIKELYHQQKSHNELKKGRQIFSKRPLPI